MSQQDVKRLLITEELAAAAERQRKEAELKELERQMMDKRRELYRDTPAAPSMLYPALVYIFGVWEKKSESIDDVVYRTRALRDTTASRALRVVMYQGKMLRNDVCAMHGWTKTQANQAMSSLAPMRRVPRPGKKNGDAWYVWQGPTMSQIVSNLKLEHEPQKISDEPLWDEVWAFWEYKLGSEDSATEAESWLEMMAKVQEARVRLRVEGK